MANMTEDRRKEIALLIVEQMAIERGVPGSEVFKRDIGNTAQKIEVPTHELMTFYESMVPKVLGRVFGYQVVSLTMSEPRKKKFDVHND